MEVIQYAYEQLCSIFYLSVSVLWLALVTEKVD